MSAGEAPAPRPPGVPREAVLVALLGVLSAFAPLSIDMYLPALPEIRVDLGTSASLVQLSITACLVGLAAGQVLAGPVSDIFGRRRPLLAGLAAFALASAACAVAPSAALLVLMRFVQGLGGAVGIVLGRAIVRDLRSGEAAARLFALLVMVNGVMPIVAPILGGQLLAFMSWRGVFLVLCAVGLVLLLVVAGVLGETLPPERRHGGGLSGTLRTFRMLLTERAFLGLTLAPGLAFASMMSYISGSPFVLQDIHGLSPGAFSLAFGGNGLGLILCGWAAGRLVGRVPTRAILLAALCVMVAGGVLLLGLVLMDASVGVLLAALFVVVSPFGAVYATSVALAMDLHPEVAGSASGLLGLSQFTFGAIAAPLVGLAGEDTAVPMALSVSVFALLALLVYLALASGGRGARSAARVVA